MYVGQKKSWNFGE